MVLSVIEIQNYYESIGTTYISRSLWSRYIETWEVYQLGNIIRDVLEIGIRQWTTIICY